MNNKRIWMLAIIFGLIMSLIFYFMTEKEDTSQTAREQANDESVSDETAENGETKQNGLQVEHGKRAISIPVDQIQSVSGFVQPGSYVDVISIIPDQTTGEKVSQILLSHVKVLAVGQTVTPSETDTQEVYQMITFELTPEDGALLSLAKESGSLTLMMEGDTEEEVSPSVKITSQQLLKGKMPNAN